MSASTPANTSAIAIWRSAHGPNRHHRFHVTTLTYRSSRTLAGSVTRMATETELLFLDDAYSSSMEAQIVDAREGAVALDRTLFYPTGGGQPHDIGSLIIGGTEVSVTSVKKEGSLVWHAIDGGSRAAGTAVSGRIDWDRRHRLMRTHTALHVLCGVIWNEWGKAVTGGNMEPLKARMDFEFDPLPDGFAARVTELVNAEIAADRPVEISYLPRGQALGTRP